MTREFEGKTEQEAIAKAIEELHIEREDFDVEIIEPQRKGLFKKQCRGSLHDDSVDMEMDEDDDVAASFNEPGRLGEPLTATSRTRRSPSLPRCWTRWAMRFCLHRLPSGAEDGLNIRVTTQHHHQAQGKNLMP